MKVHANLMILVGAAGFIVVALYPDDTTAWDYVLFTGCCVIGIGGLYGKW